ncbi:hypothetical protein [Microvirga aerophila]|uniref:Uncharacterized protein n=1 Tax=Microvirga aerophila TaxID=670291 RepID=A0A512C1W7_9HYPH|nr:hypothetical protein [Microvirga aerophila]GEO18169.1 hypothetical protein MAE02_58650 [Microvirga aerophila]
MNNDNNGAIVFLLAAILCVMLFGSAAVLSGIGTLMTIGAVLSVGCFIIWGIARLFGAMRTEVATARTDRQPWLHFFLLWPGIIGNVVVLGLAAMIWMDSSVRFKDAIQTVPYWWVPVAMMFTSLVVGLMERAHEWVPQVPGAIVAMLKGWLWFAFPPVASPVGRWREIRERRGQGEQIGVISIALSLLGALLVGILLWPLGTFLPFGIVAAIIAEVSR